MARRTTRFPFPGHRIGAGVTALAATTLLFAGCASPSPIEQDSTTASIDGTWGDPTATGSPYLEFDANGSVSGTDGCNRLIGTWTGTAEAIEFGEFSSTRMACVDTDDWLSGACSATISGSTMTVLGAGEQELGSLERPAEQDASLRAETLGRWGSSDDTKPYLSIAGDGSFVGSDGCNSLTGTWTPATGQNTGIQIGGASTTDVACPDLVDGFWRLTSADVDGNALKVLDSNGDVLAKLDRVG
ncbi:META domain-containing protein [Leucobacter sp. GX0328]